MKGPADLDVQSCPKRGARFTDRDGDRRGHRDNARQCHIDDFRWLSLVARLVGYALSLEGALCVSDRCGCSSLDHHGELPLFHRQRRRRPPRRRRFG